MARHDARWMVLGAMIMTVAIPATCFARWGSHKETVSEPAATATPTAPPAATTATPTAVPAATDAHAGRQSFSGSIVTLYPNSEPPSVQVGSSDGNNVMLLVDSKAASISRNGRRVTLAELNGGDTVQVRFAEQNGSKWLESLDVVKAYTPPPAPAPDVAAPAPKAASAPTATVASPSTPVPTAVTPTWPASTTTASVSAADAPVQEPQAMPAAPMETMTPMSMPVDAPAAATAPSDTSNTPATTESEPFRY